LEYLFVLRGNNQNYLAVKKIHKSILYVNDCATVFL
jgi:hypothetical protein